MEPGKAYLIITVDWFAWVGRMVKPVGPFEYEFESVSKVSETNNGDNWAALCKGDKRAREAATYMHYEVKALLGIGAVAKIEWIGKTPQEAGL